jgi:hypothetical protein
MLERNAKNIFLYIEGGGSRVKIAVRLLARIEDELRKHTTEIFDFFSGLSSGGMLVTLLNLKDNDTGLYKYSATSIDKNWKSFMNYEPDIENTDFIKFIRDKKVSLYEICKSDNFFIKPDNYKCFLKQNQYYHCQMIDWYSEYLTGTIRLSDTIKPIYINSFLLNKIKVFIFSTNGAKKCKDQNFYLKDVLKSSVAFVSSNDISQVNLKKETLYFTDQIYTPGFSEAINQYLLDYGKDIFDNTKFVYLGTAVGMGKNIPKKCDIGFGYKKCDIFKKLMHLSGLDNNKVYDIIRSFGYNEKIINTKKQEFYYKFTSNSLDIAERAGIPKERCYIFEPEYNRVGKIPIAYINKEVESQYESIADEYFNKNKSKIIDFIMN